MSDLLIARARVRAAMTAVTDTLSKHEVAAWKRELELLREVEASLTERLNQRHVREAVQLEMPR